MPVAAAQTTCRSLLTERRADLDKRRTDHQCTLGLSSVGWSKSVPPPDHGPEVLPVVFCSTQILYCPVLSMQVVRCMMQLLWLLRAAKLMPLWPSVLGRLKPVKIFAVVAPAPGPYARASASIGSAAGESVPQSTRENRCSRSSSRRQAFIDKRKYGLPTSNRRP